MTTQVLADSTPLYAATDTDDQYHTESRLSLELMAESGNVVVVPSFVVIEAYSLIVQRLGSFRALRWLNEIDDYTVGMHATPEDFDVAAEILRFYSDQALTMVDAMLFVMSERTGWPIWTYDHHFNIMRANRWYS